MDWINFLKIMLVDEKCAIAKYKQAAANAKDADLKKMFTEMMGEEIVHVQIIEGKIEQIKKKAKQIGKKK
jgi:rubrerythrin